MPIRGPTSTRAVADSPKLSCGSTFARTTIPSGQEAPYHFCFCPSEGSVGHGKAPTFSRLSTQPPGPGTTRGTSFQAIFMVSIRRPAKRGVMNSHQRGNQRDSQMRPP